VAILKQQRKVSQRRRGAARRTAISGILKRSRVKLNVEEEREIIEVKPERAKLPDSTTVLSTRTLLPMLDCTSASQSLCSSVSHNFGIRFGTFAIKSER
jgi:hypothetical protein